MATQFERERVLIGQGKVAKVYSWNGFAYKCFGKTYPLEWIDYELNVQREICKTDLNVPRYYESEVPGSIKMDLINGVTMADRIRREKYGRGLEDLCAEYIKCINIRAWSCPCSSRISNRRWRIPNFRPKRRRARSRVWKQSRTATRSAISIIIS